MGEIADSMIWAEMNGYDPSEPEDWIEEYAESLEPPSSEAIAFDAFMLLDDIKEWIDEDDEDPPGLADVIYVLFPKLTEAEATIVAEGLILLAGQYKGDIL